MKEILINPARACSVSGHRILDKTFDKELLKREFEKFIEKGYDTFLIGMALGFDTECFKILENLKKMHDIRLIACIPCPTQSYKFSVQQKKEYEDMLSVADEKVVISEKYTNSCMQKRNKFLIDNSSVLIAYLRKNFGGTFNTVRYAEKKGIKVVKI